MSGAADLFAKARAAHRAGRDLDARLALAAGISALAGEAGLRPVVVGGTAVDFYAASSTPNGLAPSRRIRASLDLDIITLGSFGGQETKLRLLLSGSHEFESEKSPIRPADRRKWWLRGAPMLVEVLGGDLYGDPERIVRLEVEGGTAYLWGPEDTAWQSMQLALSERRPDSWERAVAIAAAQADEGWDWAYLRSRADALAPVELVAALEAQESYDGMLERVEAAMRPGRA